MTRLRGGVQDGMLHGAPVDRRAEQHRGGVGRRVVGQQRDPRAAIVARSTNLSALAPVTNTRWSLATPGTLTGEVCLSAVRRDRKKVPHPPAD
jgi:hypothetical protein